MKKLFASLFLLLMGMCMQVAQAEPVTEQQARERAAAFLHQNHQQRAVRAVAGTVINDEPVLAYSEPQGRLFVYNAADKATGFVIIAGTTLLDDPVLGYTEQGAFDPNNIPCNMEWWMENATNYIHALETGLVSPPVTNAPYMASRSNVSPFLTSKWDQISPYNAKIPDGCVTGCVATAFAQVLYYYKSPTSTKKTIPSWKDPSGHTGPAVPSGTALNLSSCKDTYSYGETSTAATAVANLMLYCGTAVRMEWGPSASNSGEFEAATSLVEYFGYSTLIRDYPWDSSIFTQEQWIDLIYTEVAAKRPVMFSGGTGSNGHVFLCDGYQKSDNKFHINWGWGGTDDGYYSLFNFNPPHGSNYSGWNSAVIGIQPKQSSDPSCPPLSVLMPVKIENSGYVEDFTEHVITRSSTSSSFTSSKGFYYAPGLLAAYDTFGSFSYDIAFGIYNQSGTLLETYGATNNYKTFTGASRDGGGISYNWYGKPITISSSISNGTYYIYPVCKKNGTTKWYPMLQAAWYNLKVVINGTKATVTQGSYTGFEGYSSSGGTTTDTTAPTLGSISTSNITSSSVKLSWNAASDNVTSPANLQYQVQYKTSSSSWTPAKSYTKNLTSFEVTNLAASTTYTFRVTVKDEAGNTAYKEVSATTTSAGDTEAPKINSLTTSDITSSSVKLTWSVSDNVTSASNIKYFVNYRLKGGSESDWQNGTSSWKTGINEFTVTGLAASTAYELRLTAKDEAGNTALKIVNATTAAASTTTDYGVTIAGTALTSDVVKPGETKTITNSYITGSVKASVNSAGNRVTITLYNATINTSSSLNAVLRCEDGLPVTLDVNGTNTLNASYGSGIMVKNTSILITGNGTLNLSGPWYSIFTYTGGTAEIQGNVKLYCNGDISGNGYGTSGETLIIGGHAYVNVITGNVERLQRLNLLDNIDLLYPYRATAIISHQYDSSHADMGLAVVKSFPSGGDVGTIGELYTGGGIVFGERYGMGVGSVRVDAYNAADILGNGQFSFDASKNELTMNNATLEIGQEFNLDQGYYNMEVINIWNENPITIKLVGNNTISSKSNGIPVLRQKDTNPKIIFTGTGSLECKAGGSWGNNEGEVFYISNSVEFNGPEVQTLSGMSAIRGLTSSSKVIVSKGKLALNAWWGSFSSDPSVEPDGPVLIQSLAGLTLNNGLVIVNPKGGNFSSALGSITKNGSTAYKGSVLIGDASLGIESISNDPSAVNRYYTLDGRIVNGTPGKGVYIINGKKVVIK